MEEEDSSSGSWTSDVVDPVDAIEDLEESATCLFCSESFATFEQIFEHIKAAHNLDLIHECYVRNCDCLEYIRLINFLRTEKVPPTEVFNQIDKWKTGEQYLKPVLIEDALLRFDIDGAYEIIEQQATNSVQLKQKITQYEEKISNLQSTVDNLRLSIQNIIDERNDLNHSGDSEPEQEKDTTYENEHYFSSYSHFAIHHEMLSDVARTTSYQKAILNNREAFVGKTVLDVGCGTGILSMFCATAGAKHVLAVDDSDMAFYAMTIVTENRLNQQIEVAKRKVEDLSDDKKFDIIVSEWMGYFLLFEGMLDTVINSRDRFLKPGGILLPNKSTIKIAGVADKALNDRHVKFWEDVYGYKMTSLKHECLLEAAVEVCPQESVATEPGEIANIDLMTCTVASTHNIETDFSLRCTKTGTITAICGWFDTDFDIAPLSEKVVLTTSPFEMKTHWKQTLFLLRSPIELVEGNCLEGRISISRMEGNARALQIKFAFRNGDRQEFFMN